jgi:hypothetical protein
LTGKLHSAKLASDDSLIRSLREKHGQDFESCWRQTFGFGYDSLTRGANELAAGRRTLHDNV